MILLPACLVGAGALGGALLLGLMSLVTGQFDPRSLPLLTGFAAQFFIYAMMGPLVQEAVAARRQGRRRAGLAGWASLVVALPVLTALYWPEGRPVMIAGAYLIAVTVLVVPTFVLYQGRTDFTR